jgi:hypothetical protein
MKHKKVINAGFGNGGALSVSQVAYNVFAVNARGRSIYFLVRAGAIRIFELCCERKCEP